MDTTITVNGRPFSIGGLTAAEAERLAAEMGQAAILEKANARREAERMKRADMKMHLNRAIALCADPSVVNLLASVRDYHFMRWTAPAVEIEDAAQAIEDDAADLSAKARQEAQALTEFHHDDYADWRRDQAQDLRM